MSLSELVSPEEITRRIKIMAEADLKSLQPRLENLSHVFN